MLKLIRVFSLLGALVFIMLMLFDVSPTKELRIAEAAMRSHDYDQAIMHARKALWAGSDDMTIKFNSLVIQIKSALSFNRRVYPTTVLSPEASAPGHEQLQFAERCLSELAGLRPDPACHSCYLSRGDLHFELGNYQEAIEDFNAGLRAGTNLPPGVLYSCGAKTAEAQAALGQQDKAMKKINEVIRTDRNNPRGYLIKSSLLYKKGDTKEAITQAETAYNLIVEYARQNNTMLLSLNHESPLMVWALAPPDVKKWQKYYFNLIRHHDKYQDSP